MAVRTIYHAISSQDITEFNKELKEHTDEGYMPQGSLSVAITCTDSLTLFERYSILLYKMVDVADNPE